MVGLFARLSKWDKTRIVLLALSFALVLVSFRELLLVHAPAVFNDPLEDMSFAWYVPLFSAYVIWRERAKIIASAREPSVVGALAVLCALFCGFLGMRGVQVRLEILSFASLVAFIPWAFYGPRMAARLFFPAAFLLFCMPFASFLDVVTVHLRLIATSVATVILHGAGADIVRTGTMISSSDGSFAIDVASPCSGLRSLFALLALSAGYSYFALSSWPRRALLFVLSVPIAILGNVVRILSICAVGSFASTTFATGFYHDYSGYVIFAVSILLMLLTASLLGRGEKK